MKFTITGTDKVQPKMCDLIPGTMVVLAGVIYVKVDKQKNKFNRGDNDGIPRITWKRDQCVLIDPNTGKLSEVDALCRVKVVEPCNINSCIEVVDITNSIKLNKYLRTTSNCTMRS